MCCAFESPESHVRGILSYIPATATVQYLEDNTQWRGDMNFMFGWQEFLPREHKIHIFELTCIVFLVLYRQTTTQTQTAMKKRKVLRVVYFPVKQPCLYNKIDSVSPFEQFCGRT